MKDTKKGILRIFIVILAIALLGYIAFLGIGKAHKGSAKNIRLGLDLAGGVSVTYQTVVNNPTTEQMADTIEKLSKRAEDISTEAEVYKEGSNRVNVDIPGAKNAEKVLKQLGSVGKLVFKDSSGKVVLEGSDLADAKATMRTEDVKTVYAVSLKMTPKGANKFAEATKENLGKSISIEFDGKVLVAPTVQSVISDGSAEITGQNSYEDAESLASAIRSGALPLELKEIRSNVVGAKLGLEAIDTSLLAGMIGFALIVLFMLVVYRIPGLAASIALVFYIGALSFILNIFDVTLTLSGVAGILLSVGMAVDANVIIFTRMKEELGQGKSLSTSMKNGFEKALSAIVDGNVTTIIAAVVLFYKGSGTIKGFAQTLMMGILLSMFTALVVTKFVLNALIQLGFEDAKFFGIKKDSKVRPFVKNRFKFFGISGVLILLCIGTLIYNNNTIGGVFSYGLDFKGGTLTSVTFNASQKAGEFKKDVEKLVNEAIGEVPILSEVPKENMLTIKTRELTSAERATLSKQFVETYQVDEQKITAETISGSVSDEMKSNAVIAVVISSICMLIYIWIRFKDLRFGTSAVIALIHDVLIVILAYALCSAFGILTVGNSFIACILTILGYSINSTIVIFDRIRENKNDTSKKEDMEYTVDFSISQTITRNINTTLTTFIMVFVLYILGVDSIKEFTLPLMVGIVGGAYSSIFISGPLLYTLYNMFKKKKAA